MTPDDPQDVVRLVTAPNPAAAYIIKQALEGEGIQCHVVGEFLDAGIGDIPGVTPELWVHRDDLAKAEEIVRRHEAPAS